MKIGYLVNLITFRQVKLVDILKRNCLMHNIFSETHKLNVAQCFYFLTWTELHYWFFFYCHFVNNFFSDYSFCFEFFASERFTYLNKLNLVQFSYCGLILGSRQFFKIAQAASKNDTRFKSGQNWPKNTHLARLNFWHTHFRFTFHYFLRSEKIVQWGYFYLLIAEFFAT